MLQPGLNYGCNSGRANENAGFIVGDSEKRTFGPRRRANASLCCFCIPSLLQIPQNLEENRSMKSAMATSWAGVDSCVHEFCRAVA